MKVWNVQKIFEVARSANLAPRKEEAALIPSNNSKPADVLIPNFVGKPLAFYVTIVHLLTSARLTSSVSNPGQTLITAFNNNCRHTLEACIDEGILSLFRSVRSPWVDTMRGLPQSLKELHLKLFDTTSFYVRFQHHVS